ncbi:MAG: SRPBCC family protein [Flavobacteriales bacterium]|nr:SRPBCC family protein [Flavobacteriales bacterium]
MKAGKQILKWAIIFCLSFVTFNWFISGEIESTIEINAPVEDVYLQVVDLQTWPTWAVWWVRDTDMTTEYSGEESGKGAKMSWKSSEGDGSLEILECTYASSIYNELLFEGMPPSYGVWKFEKTKNGTKVTWGFKDDLPFLMHFMQLFITPDLKDGLEGLKKVCEYQLSRSPEVEIKDYPL